ncbi:hypothetical protein BDB01DRAFT_851219 [Pilobolus umbonatus]|nr:hypothetical protein BDB01DRAFT_851219 [Pilobolus umbonatus]
MNSQRAHFLFFLLTLLSTTMAIDPPSPARPLLSTDNRGETYTSPRMRDNNPYPPTPSNIIRPSSVGMVHNELYGPSTLHRTTTPPNVSLLQSSHPPTHSPSFSTQRIPLTEPISSSIASNSNSNSSSNGISFNHPASIMSHTTAGYRPLNVKDALSYLDQVKVKFADQPEVYNRFLDIMKEFKSQAIDTPGVIDRVSTLFKGYPMLISGFNTFLPPGYRIECTTDDHARDVIKVTTPSGTTSTTDGETTIKTEPNDMRYYTPNQPTTNSSYNTHINTHPAPITPPANNTNYRHNGLPSLSTYAPTSQHSSRVYSPAEDQTKRRAPVEFNHAINYVNKIKNRFSNDPDTYKQFLEILQTYQKEQKPIQEVYAQVQVLFNGAEDLLAEFKQFLPDTTQPHSDIPLTNGQKKVVGKKRSLMGLPKQKRPKNNHTPYYKTDLHSVSDTRHRSPVAPQKNDTHYGPIITDEEAEFFQKIQKYIVNKSTYHSFLKVLNLFSQQIIDQNTLVEKCESYLGGQKELFDQLKKLIGYDGKDKIIENKPMVSLVQKPDLVNCQEYGPSYRLVPTIWQKQSCSGRDALCWEVLNDAYVSHPTWASEDSGFIASKKNIFEEALHRVEEERYDYDLNIEANANTIALLEPISKKMANMSEEEKSVFRLPPGLGGPSKTIYQRVIKKVYGNEKGKEIIEMLHNSPAQTIPVILKRLKQKDDEWKKAQRDWNKVWREIEAKNYYKALDYQGITFKTSDRRAMSNKSLVTEIEALHLDQEQDVNNRLGHITPQFTFEFKDSALFKDVTRVLFSYFEHQSNHGIEDCELMKAFVEMFLPIFFDVPDVLPSPEQEMEEDETDQEEIMNDMDDDDDDNTQISYDTHNGHGRSFKRPYQGRRSPRNKPSQQNEDDRLLKDVLTKKIKIAPVNNKIEEKPEVVEEDIKSQKIYNFFGNTSFYCFFRLFQLAYDRLHRMKELDKDYRDDFEKTKRQNKAAIESNTTNKKSNSVYMDFKGGYYKTLLNLIDMLFAEKIDQYAFEESIRYIFGTKAYMLFTIDKLMSCMMRQLYHIVTDTKNQELLNLFKKHHEYEKSTTELTRAYRLSASELLGSDDLIYNLAFDTYHRTLSIQLLRMNDETFGLRDLDEYTEYVTNYINWNNETTGVDQGDLGQRYLKRNIRAMNNSDFQLRSNMEYKICRNTYHLFYVIGTEDVLIRRRMKPGHKQTNRLSWIDKQNEQRSHLDDITRKSLLTGSR